MRGKIPQLREALDRNFTEAHARLVAQMLHRLDRVEQALVELDELIAEACRPWRTSWSCCRPSPESARRSPKSSWPGPAQTCPVSPRRRTVRPGPGWRRGCVSPPAVGLRSE